MEERIDIVITERGSRVVQRNVQDIGEAARRASSGLDFLKKALAGLAVYASVRELVKLVDTYTVLNNKLRATGLSGQNLTAVYKELLTVANQTRQSLEGTVDTYSRISNSAKALGLSQKDAIEFTKSLNQAIALSGATANEAQAGMQQLGQALGTGKLSADELTSVLENLPGVADVIAKQMGVARGALKQLGADGKISADVIFKAFKNAREELDARFGKSIPTISESLQVLENNAVDLAGEFNKATGFSEILSKALLLIANNLETIAKVAIAAASGLILIGGTSIAIDFVTKSVVKLNLAIAANPIGALLIVLVSAVTALTLFRDQISLGVDDITTLGDLMRALGEQIGSGLNKILTAAEATFGPLIDYIRQFLDGVDFSVIGVLRLVAKGVDVYIGFWKGAIDAVIALFKGIGPAISDLTTQALNKILKNIGYFVNAAGDLLNSVTEFAGLGKIASTIDFELDNKDKGAAAKLGGDIGKAFSEGFAGVNLATNFLDETAKRAQEIAKARKAAETDKGSVSDKGGTRAGPSAQVLKDLKELVSNYDKVYAAEVELKKATDLLNKAESEGAITAERKAQVMALVNDQLRDQLDPIGAVNRQLDDELKLLRLTADAREVEAQAMAIDKDLRSQGIIQTDYELKQMHERLSLMQEEAKLSQARDQILQSSVGTQKDFTTQIAAMNQLLAEGKITQAQANEYLVQSNSDLFAGTMLEQQTILTQYESAYAKIDELRQADLISEETASDAKLRLWAAEQAARLTTAQTFFTALEGFSKSHNSKLAAIGKAAAIANAVIDTYKAATGAYASLASIPYVGPALGIAAAAAAVAAGVANVQRIRSTPTGFQTGGYTGNSAVDQVAGVVHGQEFVMNASATRRIGQDNLETLQRTGSLPDPARGAGQGSEAGAPLALNVTIVNKIDGAGFTVNQIDERSVEVIAERVVRQKTDEITAGNLSNPSSKTSRSLSKNTKTVRSL